MKKTILTAEKRAVTGRKVKVLRKAGKTPATIYGKKVNSESIMIDAEAFRSVYGDVGETGLIELTIEGNVKPVLIQHVQRDPVDGNILHAELHQVDLKEKVTADVPIHFEGTPPAVSQKQGILIQALSSLEVEALPSDLPEYITADVRNLDTVGNEIRVSDLTVPRGVTVMSDPDLTVAKISPLAKEEVSVQPPPTEAAVPEVSEAGENTGSEDQQTEESPHK